MSQWPHPQPVTPELREPETTDELPPLTRDDVLDLVEALEALGPADFGAGSTVRKAVW